MPKAAMDEDREFFADEGNIRSAGNSFVMQSITAEAGVPKGFAESDFGCGVFGAVGAHDAGNRFVLWRRRSFVADVHKRI